MSEKSRVIVLTGATRGLGRAMAEGFVARGHIVWGCGRSETHVKDLRATHAAPHDWSVVDVADARSVDAWAARFSSQKLVPDLLINNAALMNTPRSTWKVEQAEFDALIDVNIKGVGNVIRAFVPSMVAKRRGVIVNFSSGWGRGVSSDVAPYCATKWAMEGLSKAMAEEVPAGMAVVPLHPGVIDTDMLRSCWGAAAGGFAAPEQWAEAAVPFILSLGARDNGRSVTVPGAFSD